MRNNGAIPGNEHNQYERTAESSKKPSPIQFETIESNGKSA